MCALSQSALVSRPAASLRSEDGSFIGVPVVSGEHVRLLLLEVAPELVVKVLEVVLPEQALEGVIGHPVSDTPSETPRGGGSDPETVRGGL